MVIGFSFKQIPTLVQRICGICSPAHLICALEAIEQAFKINVSEQTCLMQKLILYGNLIKSHSTHLYFLSLPDYLKKTSVLDFDKNEQELIHRAIHLKEAGDEIVRVFGGRATHPVNAVVGGFESFPSQRKVNELLKKLKLEREKAVQTIKLFNSFLYVCEIPTNYVALVNEDYNFLDGRIHSSSGKMIEEKDYGKYLHEEVMPYSTAKHAKMEGKEFFVGALARMNLNQENLNFETKKTVKHLKVKIHCFSPFSNNLAQAIEVLHAIDSCIEILSTLTIQHEKPVKAVPSERVQYLWTEHRYP
jgi:coenzyme F420-reducing hydrogenase alpha subunit